MAQQPPKPVHTPVSSSAAAPAATYQRRFYEPHAPVFVHYGHQSSHSAADSPGCTRHVPASRGSRRTPSSTGSAQCKEEARELQRCSQWSTWCQSCVLYYCLCIERVLRKTATPPVCGKITIWITRTTSIRGSTCASRKKSLSNSKGILDMQGQNHSTHYNKSNVNSLLLVSQDPRLLPSRSENMPPHPLLHLCTPILLEEVP